MVYFSIKTLVSSGAGKFQPEGHGTVGNEARRVSDWNGGPEGWDFPVLYEHQWWILSILKYHPNKFHAQLSWAWKK